jgi:hypothetical protein
MSFPFKLITWATAIITWLMWTLILHGQYNFDNYDKPHEFNFVQLLFDVALGFSLQVGLFVSPFVIGRSIVLRFLALLLMLPFVYYVLLHDVAVLWREFSEFDSFRLADWRLNFKSRLFETFTIITLTVVYGGNLILLSMPKRFLRHNKLT